MSGVVVQALKLLEKWCTPEVEMWPRRWGLLMERSFSILKQIKTFDFYWLNASAYCHRKHCNFWDLRITILHKLSSVTQKRNPCYCYIKCSIPLSKENPVTVIHTHPCCCYAKNKSTSLVLVTQKTSPFPCANLYLVTAMLNQTLIVM